MDDEEEILPLDNFLSCRRVLIRKDAVKRDVTFAVHSYVRNFSPKLSDFASFWCTKGLGFLHILCPYKDEKARRDVLSFIFSVLWKLIGRWDQSNISSLAPTMTASSSLSSNLRKYVKEPIACVFFMYAMYKTQPPSTAFEPIYTELCDYEMLLRLFQYLADGDVGKDARKVIRGLVKEDAFLLFATPFENATNNGAGAGGSLSSVAWMENETLSYSEQLTRLYREKRLYDEEIQTLGFADRYDNIAKSEEMYSKFKHSFIETYRNNNYGGTSSSVISAEDNKDLRGEEDELWLTRPGFIDKVQENFHLYDDMNRAKQLLPIDYLSSNKRRGRKRKRQELLSLRSPTSLASASFTVTANNDHAKKDEPSKTNSDPRNLVVHGPGHSDHMPLIK